LAVAAYVAVLAPAYLIDGNAARLVATVAITVAYFLAAYFAHRHFANPS
jgi:hypothetical protein